MKIGHIFPLIVALSASGAAHAQFVPVQAKISELREVTLPDNKIILNSKQGVFYRSSDGSVLIHWLNQNGKEAWDGTLHDNKGLAFYELDYKQHRAMEHTKKPPTAVKPGSYNSITRDVGTDTVEGIGCRIIPIKLGRAGSSSTDIGKSCVSTDYDLRLWEDVTVPTVENRPERTRTRLYEIKLGSEPDPSLFDVKSAFKVYLPQSGTPAGAAKLQP